MRSHWETVKCRECNGCQQLLRQPLQPSLDTSTSPGFAAAAAAHQQPALQCHHPCARGAAHQHHSHTSLQKYLLCLHSLTIKKHLEMLLDSQKRRTEEDSYNNRRKREKSLSLQKNPSRSLLCLPLRRIGNNTVQQAEATSNTLPPQLRHLQASMLFPVLQICLPVHPPSRPHLGRLWEAKADSQFDCHSLREISAKINPELRFLNCFLHCHQNLLFKQDLPRLQILTK